MDKKYNFEDIVNLSAELNNIQDVDILLERILLEARKSVQADAGTIYIRKGENLVFNHAQNATLQSKLPKGKKLIYSTFTVPITHTSIAGYVASTGEILNIPDAYNIPENKPYHFDSSYDDKAHYKTTSMLTIPLKTQIGETLGVLQVINHFDDSDNIVAFDHEDELFAHHFANTASMVLQRAQMTRALLLRMIQMAELRDPKETGAHVNRVASYSVEIYEKWARGRSIKEDEIQKNRDILRMAAMLHDAGKVAISDLILKKPARFTNEEYEMMKTHTYLGAKLFQDKQSEFDEVAAEVALTHHENWDGTGYPGHINIDTGEAIKTTPDGKALPKKNEEISIYGRIVALADVFDALSSKRVYKDAWTEDDVLQEIKKCSGSKFDPEIVDIFFDSLDLIKSIQARYSE